MTDKELLEVLKNADCFDPFECIFGMYGANENKCYGCFAQFPNGDPHEENQGCIAHQAAKLIERLMKNCGEL